MEILTFLDKAQIFLLPEDEPYVLIRRKIDTSAGGLGMEPRLLTGSRYDLHFIAKATLAACSTLARHL